MNGVRYGLRMVRRTPVLSTVAVLTIGLGIGSVTYAFGVLDGTLLRGLPVRNADRLMAVTEARPAEGIDLMWMPVHDYEDLRAWQSSFERLEAVTMGTMNLAGEEGPPERFSGAQVTAGLFSMLGIEPILGRGFAAGDDGPGKPALVLLGHDVWRNRFVADASIIGRTVRVNGESATVIGVMPSGFRFPFYQDLWLPLRLDAEALPRGGGPRLLVTGHLREGVTRQAASAEMAALAARLQQMYPEDNRGITTRVRPFADAVIPSSISSMLFLLLPMVGGVLLVACANVANLLLSRAVGREREMVVRTALGAQRGRVIGQLLLEALILGVAGGAVGLVLAHVGLHAFERDLQGIQKPYWIVYQLDVTVLLVTSVVTVGAALAAGILPALRASTCEVAKVLRDEARGSSGLRLGRCSTWLVVGELAVSCGLMIGAGLLVRALVDLNRVDLGFSADGVTTARVGLMEADYPGLEDCNRFHHRLLDELTAEPGVRAVALTSHLPATTQGRWYVQVEGAVYTLPSDVPAVGGAVVSPGFFETFDAPLREGRDFTREESEGGGREVVIVNQAFVDRYLGSGPALGRRLRLGREDTGQPWLEVVGVAPNLFEGVGAFGGGGRLREAIYLPLAQATPRFLLMAVRSVGPSDDAGARLRKVVAGLDPNLPVHWVQPMRVSLDEATMWHRLFGKLFATFAVAALFLAAVGLFGIVSFSVSSRLHEMGIRIAIGAGRAEIAWLVARRVLGQLGVGSALGLAIGMILGRPLSAALSGVRSWDPVVAAVVLGAMVLTGIVAALAPAVRAMRVDPVTAFRA